MSDCSKHKKEVAGISDMRELATKIGDLHYATLAELLHYLHDKFYSDALKDGQAGRTLLSEALLGASWCIQQAQVDIDKAYKISKPFMNNSTIEP